MGSKKTILIKYLKLITRGIILMKLVISYKYLPKRNKLMSIAGVGGETQSSPSD